MYLMNTEKEQHQPIANPGRPLPFWHEATGIEQSHAAKLPWSGPACGMKSRLTSSSWRQED
jgi:hypothetical protein